ncbi:MAG: hypothetical protein HYT80_09335 [Euryarchaeota archaeon]|nr:hypothetical protein [Euryarchaeota archaeon]
MGIVAGTNATNEAKPKGNGIRWTILISAWIIMGLVVAQVLFIGLGLAPLYNSPAFAELHIGVGWAFGHLGALLLIVSFVLSFWGHVPPTIKTLVGLDALLLAALPFLAGAREPGTDVGKLISGLHPLIAITVFALSFLLAVKLRALMAAREPATTPSGPRAVPPPTAPAGATTVGRMVPPLGR